MLPATTIIANYLAIALYLTAFWLVYLGSQALVRLAGNGHVRGTHHNLIVIATTVVGVFYTHFTLQNPNRTVATTRGADEASFYLSDWLILLTIVVPYVITWFIGFYAAFNIIRYTDSVPGILYKRLLGSLAKGLVAIVLVTVLLQFLRDFQHIFADLSLTPLLMIIYLLLAAYTVGYIYVAAGASKLQRIEEV
jgi:hypothetical protein